MKETIIIGAGLAGLLAACKFKDATIYEAGQYKENHKALLRFRDKSVSELTGIPFKEVEVRKEIFWNGIISHRCTISFANQYSKKVTGLYQNRSIWNLEPCKRYIAPLDFHEQLVDKHDNRIMWNSRVTSVVNDHSENFINTAPLPVMMGICRTWSGEFNFARAPIHVDRYKLPRGADLYQTIYFPQSNMRVFRASITGDVLIVESLCGDPKDHFEWPLNRKEELNLIKSAFGIPDGLEAFDSIDQQYGKIIDLPREQREAILYELTRDFNVFSVGRFATWRNILLDDVVKDLNVVERLMSASGYGRELSLASR